MVNDVQGRVPAHDETIMLPLLKAFYDLSHVLAIAIDIFLKMNRPPILRYPPPTSIIILILPDYLAHMDVRVASQQISSK